MQVRMTLAPGREAVPVTTPPAKTYLAGLGFMDKAVPLDRDWTKPLADSDARAVSLCGAGGVSTTR